MDTSPERVTRELLATADAVPYGGARLAVAGGGRPARLTTAAISTIALGGNSQYCGVVIDPDELHVWHVGGSAGNRYLKRYLISTGAADATVDMGDLCFSVTRSGTDLIVAGFSAKKFYVVSTLTAAITATITPSGAPSPYCVVRDSTGKFWSINTYTGGTLTEYGADGTATGNTIAGTWTGVYVHDSFPGVLWAWSSAAIKKIQLSDRSTLVTATPAAKARGAACENWTPFSGCVDSSGRIYAWQALLGVVDRWSAAGVADARVMWMDDARGMSGTSWIAGSMQHAPCFCLSSTWAAWMAATTGATALYNAIRVRCVGAQGGIWTRAAQETRAVTLKRVCFAGDDGNSGDYTPTKFYVSTDGVSYTEVENGVEIADGAGIAIGVGVSLRVKWETALLGVPPAGDPFCGGDEGEAVVLEIEDTGAVEYPVYADPTSATTLAAIRNAIKAQIVGLTPSSRKDVRFREAPASTTWADWIAANKASQCFRVFSVERDPDSQTEELPLHSPSARYVDDWLLLRVAYPLAPGLYGKEGWEDLEDVLEGDADQLAGRAENCDYYLTGQVQTAAEERALDRTDGVAVLTIRLRCRYYKTRGS